MPRWHDSATHRLFFIYRRATEAQPRKRGSSITKLPTYELTKLHPTNSASRSYHFACSTTLKCAFAGLGFGTTYTFVAPIVSRCSPSIGTPSRRSPYFKNGRYAVNPWKHATRGRYRLIFRTSRGAHSS